MSWLFSQALVEEYSEAICSDGEPFAQLNVMPTQHKFWRNDKPMEHLKLSQFGLTLRLLTEQDGEALLMSYLAGFHAKTLALQGKEKESRALGQACGLSSLESFARYDLSTSTWKTPQLSLLEDSEEFSETWPRSGVMQNGVCWELQTLQPPMIDTEYGFLQKIPTPTTQDNVQIRGEGGAKGKPTRGTTLGGYVHKFPTPTATEYGSNLGGGAGRVGKERLSLTSMARRNKWPTATATATAYKGWSKNHNRANTDDRLDYTVEREASQSGQAGRLNPQWVEWLMGWPIGWTELKPLEMGRFQEWLRQHLPSSANN